MLNHCNWIICRWKAASGSTGTDPMEDLLEKKPMRIWSTSPIKSLLKFWFSYQTQSSELLSSFIFFDSSKIRNRDSVLLLLPEIPGRAQPGHFSAHVLLHHAAHHHHSLHFSKHHPERPRSWYDPGFYVQDKKKVWSFWKLCLSAGSVCSVYPSSTRLGLVIFHEHITDLLSGGVSS